MFGPLGFSLAPYIKSSRTLSGWFKPFAAWYAQAAGYRQFGLKYDDLLVEERDDVQRAIGRLTTREGYDRAYRFKRASQCSVLQKQLPKEEWIKPEEDVRYLRPHVVEVEKENLERQAWDTASVKRN
ncbi:hypothetical protein HGRIS_013290 [Hohenbuehelia grisea]|uniref:Cytochrome b-c1 complex subunit 7 n=1 Tax=Hohenbuehelia grisea TaxID=104357 RepID=A0ABR3IV68_9AGAR